MKQVRASIKAYQQAYVQKIGELIGTDDPTEIIAKIITDHQLQNNPKPRTEPQSKAEEPSYVVIRK